MNENNETDELYELFECVDRKEFAKEIANVISDEFSKIFKERVLPHLRRDTEGRLWYVDDNEKPVAELVGGLLSKKKETPDDRAVIQEASQLSLQKKEERLVINLPAWLKDRLKKRANRTNKSMNEIIRISLTEYLSK